MTPEQRAEDRAKAAEINKLIQQVRRQCGLTFGLVRPSPKPFLGKLKQVRAPAVWLIADVGEADDCFGPAGFHGPSLAALRGMLGAVVINSAASAPEWYAACIAAAVGGPPQMAALVETGERHFADWQDYFAATEIPVLHVLSPPEGMLQ